MLHKQYGMWCKKNEIPFPEVNSREVEHIQTCLSCQMLWPLFYFHHPLRCNFQTVCNEWSAMTEEMRKKKYQLLKKTDMSWLNRLTKKRVLSGYQEFVKSKNNQLDDTLSFGQRVAVLSTWWKELSEEERRRFTTTSAENRRKYRDFIRSLPRFQKNKYKTQRSALRMKRNGGCKRPCNAFMLYLHDRWTDEKRRNPQSKYRQIMKQVAQEWKQQLPQEDKDTYLIKYHYLRDNKLLEHKNVFADKHSGWNSDD